MTEMIERVARALCSLNGCDPDDLAPDYMMEKDRVAAGNPARRWEDWRDDAKAAILAMREPTEAMLDRGEYANSEWLNDNAPIGQRMYRAPAKSVWQTMIDEALKEE